MLSFYVQIQNTFTLFFVSSQVIYYPFDYKGWLFTANPY